MRTRAELAAGTLGFALIAAACSADVQGAGFDPIFEGSTGGVDTTTGAVNDLGTGTTGLGTTGLGTTGAGLSGTTAGTSSVTGGTGTTGSSATTGAPVTTGSATTGSATTTGGFFTGAGGATGTTGTDSGSGAGGDGTTASPMGNTSTSASTTSSSSNGAGGAGMTGGTSTSGGNMTGEECRVMQGDIPVCCTPQGSDRDDVDEVFELLNAYRNSLGIDALAHDPVLEEAMQGHCMHMDQADFFSHTSPVSSLETPWDRAELCGTSANAENIAAGQNSPAAVMEGWRNSSGHDQNMRSSGSSRVGIGKYGRYWGQVFGR